MALIAQGNIDGGVAELQEAYDILPHPNALYNIGRAYTEAGRYAQAIEYFERYVESDPSDRDEVQAFIAALRARIGAQEGRTEGATATATEGETAPAETH